MSRLPNPIQPATKDPEYFCSKFISSHNRLVNEIEFCDFYAEILRKLYLTFRTNYGLIFEALQSVRKYLVAGERGLQPDYEVDRLRFVYLFSFSIIHSVVMYDRFIDMVRINPSMLIRIQSLREFNICILGGGPGFEAAAICKLLSKAKAMFKSCSSSQLQIHVTVIDLYSEWETVTDCIFTKFQKEELHPLVKVDFCYIQANLNEEFSPAVVQAIKSSHIVTMFKFVNEVCDRYGCENAEKMLNKIVDIMSFKSCLFFLENAGGGYFKTVDKMIDHSAGMIRIYGPILHHCQELKEDTVTKYSSFVRDMFRNLKCTSKTTISCSAWLKIRQKSCKKVLEKLD